MKIINAITHVYEASTYSLQTSTLGGEMGGTEWEFGVGKCKLLNLEWQTRSYSMEQGTISNLLG